MDGGGGWVVKIQLGLFLGVREDMDSPPDRIGECLLELSLETTNK